MQNSFRSLSEAMSVEKIAAIKAKRLAKNEQQLRAMMTSVRNMTYVPF